MQNIAKMKKILILNGGRGNHLDGRSGFFFDIFWDEKREREGNATLSLARHNLAHYSNLIIKNRLRAEVKRRKFKLTDTWLIIKAWNKAARITPPYSN